MTELTPLNAYSLQIDLDVPFDRTARYGDSGPLVLRDVAGWLLADAGLTADVPPDAQVTRRLVKRLLTVRPPRPFPPEVLGRLDQLFGREADERNVTSLSQAMRETQESGAVGATRVLVWRGDITTLEVDAIVNAANADLVGCFRPEHSCIDNAIHSAAGPRLREDCQRIIDVQGHKEPTGTSKATRGYFLPSRFVLHTVGPIVGSGPLTSEHRANLASCYESCLEVAAAIRARSIAFCCVSTGVFGYPKGQAATLAVDTVRRWLESRPETFDAVIFNVFGKSDHEAYRQAWSLPS